MELHKAFKPYILSDLNFPLSDNRNKKLLKDYGIYTYNAIISENLFFNELYRSLYRLSKFEHIFFNAKKTTYIEKHVFDYLLAREIYHKTFYSSLSFFENMQISDKSIKEYSRIDKENIDIHEFAKKWLGVNKQELIHVVETYWDNILFFLHVIENIKARDSIVNAIHINKTENPVLFSDSSKKNIQELKKENIYFLERYIKRWDTSKAFREFISIDDKVKNNTNKKSFEQIGIVSKEMNHAIPTFNDHILAKDTFYRRASFILHLNDMLHIQELVKKDTRKSIKESNISIYDRYVRASNAYIEALRMVDEAQDEKWFKSMLESMPYYEEFTDFYVGDYEYKKACIRLVLQTETTDSKPTLYDMAANVDIDDTDDRGTANITDTTMPTKIYFNKHYYNAPEVQVTVNSGVGNETVTPYIVNTDGIDGSKRYFEVELRNDSNERVKGAISWISKGW